MKEKKIAVIGMGYVGMPLAIAFAKHFEVIGFDIDENKINITITLIQLERLEKKC